MTLQITFLERCKALGIADKNLPAWLDEIESLRTQIAELTERLRLSEALRTSDMETTAEQAAQIEMLRSALQYLLTEKIDYMMSNNLGNPSAEHGTILASKALYTTPSQALADFAAKVREQCADLVEGDHGCTHSDELANEIRNLKELP